MSVEKDMLRIKYFEENDGGVMDDIPVKKTSGEEYVIVDPLGSRYYRLEPVKGDSAFGFSIVRFYK